MSSPAFERLYAESLQARTVRGLIHLRQRLGVIEIRDAPTYYEVTEDGRLRKIKHRAFTIDLPFTPRHRAEGPAQ